MVKLDCGQIFELRNHQRGSRPLSLSPAFFRFILLRVDETKQRIGTTFSINPSWKSVPMMMVSGEQITLSKNFFIASIYNRS